MMQRPLHHPHLRLVSTLALLLVLLPLPLIGCSKSSSNETEAAGNDATSSNDANGGETEDTTAAAAEPEPEPINLGDPKYVKCWAHIKNETPDSGMTNNFDQLRGPAEFPDLARLSQERLRHTDWDEIITSVKAGPTARVTLYSEPEFKGESLIIEPGGQSRDMIEQPLGDGVSSIIIEFVEG